MLPNSKKLIAQVLILILLTGGGYYVYANYVDTCDDTLSYSIGSVDPRFGITSANFAELAKTTELVWEMPFDREFFHYDPASHFKINLIFDDRQQQTIDEQKIRSGISTQEQDYRNKVALYDAALANHTAVNKDYDAAVVAYDQRLKKYNEQVEYWNQNGGAPNKEYNELQKEKLSLQRESSRLETLRRNLNQAVIDLNEKAAEINALAERLHLDVNAYNGKFGTSREFDQGNYTGKEINIFQFTGQDDLKLVLAHEFGHALGLDHVEDPQAIMYYLMDKQNIKDLKLSTDDINALKTSCNIR